MNERDQMIVESLRALQNDMGRISAYCIETSENIEVVIEGIEAPPGPDPGPDPPVGFPARDVSNITEWDQAGHYAIDITNETFDGGGLTYSGAESSVAIIRGSGTLRNAKLCSSGADGIKILNGSNGATIEDVHVYGLGWKDGAHADVLQITGGVHNLTIRRLQGDIPRNDLTPGRSLRSNAVLIISSQDAPNGRIDVHDLDALGGNFTVYNISKGSGNAVADLHFHNARFYVDSNNPQYKLFQCEAVPTFHGVCQVIYRTTGEVLSTDPWAWDAAN